jgi:hypothetical protein
LTFVTSDGMTIAQPLPGAGDPTPHCDVPDKSPGLGGEENDRSLGFVATFGKARIVDLGDLTWQKEKELVCPINKIGHADLFLVSHHGFNASDSPPLVAAVSARVALMANGARKGGDKVVLETLAQVNPQTVVWQEHAATRDPEANRPDQYIANPDIQPDPMKDLETLIYGMDGWKSPIPETATPSATLHHGDWQSHPRRFDDDPSAVQIPLTPLEPLPEL